MMFGAAAGESLQLVEHLWKSLEDRLAIGLGIERGEIGFELLGQRGQFGPVMSRQLARIDVGLPIGTQFQKQLVTDMAADECGLNSVAEEPPQRLGQPLELADENRLGRHR